MGAPRATETGRASVNLETMRAAMMIGKPIGEQQHDTGEEPGLGQAQQEAQDREARGPVANGAGPDAIPQLTMMRAIQRLAPTFSRIRLLGTSKRQ